MIGNIPKAKFSPEDTNLGQLISLFSASEHASHLENNLFIMDLEINITFSDYIQSLCAESNLLMFSQLSCFYYFVNYKNQ